MIDRIKKMLLLISSGLPSIPIYGVKFDPTLDNGFFNKLFQTEVLDNDFSFGFTVGVVPALTFVIIGNGMPQTVDNALFIQNYNTGKLAFRLREAGAYVVGAQISYSEGDEFTVVRVGNDFTFTNVTTGVSDTVTTLASWTNPSDIAFRRGELTFGSNEFNLGAHIAWEVRALTIRGETFLPTYQSEGSTITSQEGGDVIELFSDGDVNLMYKRV